MKKNKSFLLLVCLIFMLNSFTFNVYALNNGTNSRAIGNVKIVSTVDTSLESVEAWARSKNATETFVGLAKLYKQYAESRGGVNWVVAYVQAAKETGYGRFGGVLDESYHNPCGLKNPSGGGDYDPNAHKRFDTWEQGVLAHLDHLALYASADGFPKTKYVDKWKNEPLAADETYDPRHIGWFGTASGILGKAKDVIGLTGSWASDPNYGIDLFRLYCEASNSEYLPAKSNLESPSNSEIIVNGKLRIKGWALHAFGIKEVKVLVDNAQVATLNTGISRADINSAYPGYFNGELSGFEETIDISQLGTGNKTVEVIIVSRNGETQSHKRNITIGKVNNLPKINTLDTPSDNTVISNEKIKIRGWALDEYGVKEVRVYVDGKDLGTVPYGTNRPDVNNVYPGYPSGNNSGFDGTVDISNISAGDKKLAVKITSNDGTEKTIERTIKVVRLETRICLDEPSSGYTLTGNSLKIRGWALSSVGIKEVRVYVDGKDLGTVPYGTNRSDVNNVYPGYPSGNNPGFDGTVNISSISSGNKTLTVRITANDGKTQTIERAIKIKRAETRVCLDEPISNYSVTGNSLKIRGWALDGSGVKEVRVYVDGKDLGTVPYGTNRADVNNVYPGYPSGNNPGFDGNVDLSNVEDGVKSLKVKISSNDGNIQEIERTIKIQRPKSIICLDEPVNNQLISSNTLKIRGWALNSTGIKEVRVYVDGKDLGTVPYGTNRADVNNVYPGYPSGNNPGFDGNVDLSNIGSGVKSLKIKVSSNNGNIQEIERKINIQRLETRTCLDSPVTNEIVAGNTLKVRGWALSSSGVREVRAYIDGKDLGTVKYGTERKDVNNVYPGYPSGNNPGFDGIIDISKVGSGDKTLVIKITENNGTVKTIERNFTHRKSKLVVVDPGHEIESVDPGASATHNGIRYVEGNLNLQIAVKLKAQLEAMGIEVYMTRYDGLIIDKDSTESLKKRVKVANELDADLFVSIHHNSYTSPSAHGFEVYYSTGTPVSTNMVSRGLITQDGRDLTLERRSYTARNLKEKSQVSKALATTISNEGSSTLGLYNRGAKDSNLYVCKNTLMPSILIENGFITNPTEAVKVSTTSHQQKLAEIVAKNVGNVLQ